MTRDDIAFDAEVGTRYHRRRANFLQRLTDLISFVILGLGTAVAGSVVTDDHNLTLISGTIIAVLSIVQVIYRPETCAARHREWLGRWNKILKETAINLNPKPSELQSWIDEKTEIETECVGEMRALAVDSYNRATRAMGKEPPTDLHLTSWQRLWMQVISFDQAFERQAQKKAEAL